MDAARLVLTLLCAFGLFGLNTTLLLEMIRKKKFTRLETTVTAIFISLIGAPLLLSLEYTATKTLFHSLPILNALALFLSVLTVRQLWRPDYTPLSQWHIIPPALRIKRLYPRAAVLFVYIALIVAMTRMYYPFPDLDPYYWYKLYEAEFDSGTITTFNLFRPLFSAFSYIVTQTGGLELYAYFKYFLSSLILLCLPPLLLVSKTQKHVWSQGTVLLFPAVTASCLSYLFAPIPQTLLLVLLVNYMCLVLYTWITGQQFFYYMSGILLFFGYFYHEIAFLAFLPWLLSTLLYERKYWLQFMRRRPALTLGVIFVIVGVLSSPAGKNPLMFILARINRILEFVATTTPNLRFPSYYVNIDTIPMGWGGFLGVAKYYLYYVGPVVLTILIAFGLYWCQSGAFRNFMRTALRKKEIATLITTFLFFFLLSEILPRAISLALLPERSWIFGGIFSLTFLVILFQFLKDNPRTLRWIGLIILVGSLVNAGATLYINSLKRFMITTSQLDSTEWIKQNLPANRLILSQENENLLHVHGESAVCTTRTSAVYFDQSSLNKTITQCHHSQAEKIKNNPDLYIYYAAIHRNNPYLNRPYFKVDSSNADQSFLFDLDTVKYKRVYSDAKNNIFIWRVLNPPWRHM